MGQQVKDVGIPGDAYTAYDIPAGGAALQLNINRSSDNLVIDDSEILLQDSSDDVQWYRSSATPVAHRYNIGTVLSSREYLHVFGHYHYTNGTGSGPLPTFNAKLAAPDVDMSPATEAQEESVGVWVPKGGARKAVTVNSVKCKGPANQQTLTWSSSKVSLWTTSSGGSILSGNSKSLSADQNYTYYAQGDNASGSIRDSEIKSAYTVSGQTAYDKVNVTVVGATIGAFDTILLNQTQDVSVTLAPNPPGITSVLQIVCLNGSGSAVFVPSGSTSSNITQSTTVKIKGVTASSAVSNMMLKAIMGSDVLASNVFTVGPLVELKSIEFTSDHESGGANILKDNNTNWTDSGTVYAEPEWVKSPATNNPISHTKNTKLTAKITVKVNPSGVTFDLIGDGPDSYVDFQKTNNTSTGSDQEITVTADANLPDQVCTQTKSINWKINVGSAECSAGSSGPHKIFITYGTPSGSEPTDNRISWSCERCTGNSALDDIVLAAYAYINTYDPPHFNVATGEWPSGTPPIWMLLDPSHSGGSCIAFANLLKHISNILGIPGGSLVYVYSSSDSAFDSQETHTINGRTCTVVVVVDCGSGSWEANYFEGCLEMNSRYYPGAFGTAAFLSKQAVHSSYAAWSNRLIYMTTDGDPLRFFDKDHNEYSDPLGISQSSCIPIP